jgi:hypothetical protein
MFRIVASLAVVAVVALSWFFFGNHDDGRAQHFDTTVMQQSTSLPADDMTMPRKPSFDVR